MPAKELPPFECAYQGTLLAGVDEVGRGPLVGAVVTAAVILDPERPIAGLADSKKLTDKKRAKLYDEIIEKAAASVVGLGSAFTITNWTRCVIRWIGTVMCRAFSGRK